MDLLLGELSEIKAENGLELLEEVNQEEMNHKPKRSTPVDHNSPTTHQQGGEFDTDSKEEKKEEEEEESSVTVTSSSQNKAPETEE